jgi:peptide/nickel transport system ATP-binding protein
VTRPLLHIEDLHVRFHSRKGEIHAVRGVSWKMGREKLGIVGESGSGKSLSVRALLGLIRPPGEVRAQRIELDGIDLRALSAPQWQAIRGRRISMVLQDPRYSLNPVMRIGDQIAEAYLAHHDVSRAEAHMRALDMLAAVHIRDPERVSRAYQHELSGGMGQRVMIAMMLMPEPEILIADEPTSALDISVQTQVLCIIDEMVTSRGMGLIFISHDLQLVASFCDRVLIMYAGRVVEECLARDLPMATHPYTRGLLACLPRLGERRDNLAVLERTGAWSNESSVP